MEQPKYKRVILKLSGEALAGEVGFGLEGDVLNSMAVQVKELVEAGVEVAIVVGGGNIWRGVTGAKRGIDRATADYMGMLATAINALALQDAMEAEGLETRVMTAIEMREVAEPYIKRKAIRHLEKGRVCIFVGGLGSPYFSTDTACILRATEIEAEVVLMAKNNTEGVYDSDPRTNPNAKLYETLTFSEILAKELQVMDSTAASLCKDNGLSLIVFNMNKDGNILKAAKGEKIGTLVTVK
jgi:uridylate kinase